MRLKDADRLKKKFCGHCEDYGKCKEQCFDLDIIDTIPTVDAEPVIRCKDCIYYEPGEEGEVWGLCNNTGAGMPTMGFCSDADRRVKEDEN